MSIAMVTGAPGAGKSFYAVREIVRALDAGKYVATNIELADGWALKIAKLNFFRRLIPGRVSKTAARFESMVLITPDLEELFRVRLAGAHEERGVMVLDEAHNWMNARTWDQDDSGKANKGEAVRRRLAVVRFFSQHRKLGWRVLLITQAETNIDNQVRLLFEYHVKLKNIRNFKVLGIRLFPFNCFVAVWLWNDRTKSRVKVQSYLLNKRVARLYDTMALSHGMEDTEVEPIRLPKPVVPPASRAERRRARSVAAGQPANAAPGRTTGVSPAAGAAPLPACPPPPAPASTPDAYDADELQELADLASRVLTSEALSSPADAGARPGAPGSAPAASAHQPAHPRQ